VHCIRKDISFIVLEKSFSFLHNAAVPSAAMERRVERIAGHWYLHSGKSIACLEPAAKAFMERMGAGLAAFLCRALASGQGRISTTDLAEWEPLQGDGKPWHSKLAVDRTCRDNR
jgi:hypothetical protein